MRRRSVVFFYFIYVHVKKKDVPILLQTRQLFVLERENSTVGICAGARRRPTSICARSISA